MSVPRRIAAFLDLARADVDAARTLAATSNRYAAYHCQQAAEKLIKAVLLHRGLESGTEHRLDILVDKLADTDPWKPKLRPLEAYSPYDVPLSVSRWTHRAGSGSRPGHRGCGRHRDADRTSTC
jgi:hypothetical protein